MLISFFAGSQKHFQLALRGTNMLASLEIATGDQAPKEFF
jgi:hypothetical protein